MTQPDYQIKYQWLWKSNDDPWETKQQPEYNAYSFEICELIETAYKNNEEEIAISENYKIDFKNRLQINVHDSFRQRPVIRRQQNFMERITFKDIYTARYRDTARVVRTFNKDKDFHGCDYIVDWFKIKTNGKLKMDNHILVDLTIQGILTEASNYPDKRMAMEDAERFVVELRKVQFAKKLTDIQEVCIRLYTEDSFLYRLVNETLRDDNREKFETLGPFMHLLYNYGGSSKNKEGKLPKEIVLYRGEPLTSEIIEEYKSSIGSGTIFRWVQFVSTSKKQSVAEQFSDGRSLFVIRMKERFASEQGVCIAPLSSFAIEAEVLLKPGLRFKLSKIEDGKNNQRSILYIDVLPSYMSGLR